NGDGKLDVLVVNQDGTVGVLLGNADGSFQPALIYYSGGVTALSVADLNGDGKPDLAIAGGGAVGVLLGKLRISPCLRGSKCSARPVQALGFGFMRSSSSLCGSPVFRDIRSRAT